MALEKRSKWGCKTTRCLRSNKGSKRATGFAWSISLHFPRRDSLEILRVENLTCSYTSGGNRFQVLKHVNLQVEEGDFIAIEGPSGSGKSTLFYILGCLLR